MAASFCRTEEATGSPNTEAAFLRCITQLQSYLLFDHPLHKLVVVGFIVCNMGQVQVCNEQGGYLSLQDDQRKCSGEVWLLTERRHIHQHEVASLWDDWSHSSFLQDAGHAIPLGLQLHCQGGEVAVRLPHQVDVEEQTLSHGLLQTHGASVKHRRQLQNQTAVGTYLDGCWAGVHGVLHHGLKVLDQVLRSDRPTELQDTLNNVTHRNWLFNVTQTHFYLPASDAERLPSAADGDGSIPHARQSG